MKYLATLLLLVGCAPQDEDNSPAEPERSDPFQPPTPEIVTSVTYPNGDLVIILRRRGL